MAKFKVTPKGKGTYLNVQAELMTIFCGFRSFKTVRETNSVEVFLTTEEASKLVERDFCLEVISE